MRAYVVTTGAAVGLILLAHVFRIAEEGWLVATQPVFALTSLASLGICVWAARLQLSYDVTGPQFWSPVAVALDMRHTRAHCLQRIA
ncbi:MAG: hypothetical protein ABIP65_06915 [Vicinamibacterales bacterium]